MDLQKTKNIVEIVFFVVLIISVVLFLKSYAFVDWEEVSESFEGTIKEAVKLLQCEIRTDDFYFKGNCDYLEELNLTNLNNCKEEKC